VQVVHTRVQAIDVLLAFQAEGRPWDRLEAQGFDTLLAAQAASVSAVLEPGQRSFDLAQEPVVYLKGSYRKVPLLRQTHGIHGIGRVFDGDRLPVSKSLRQHSGARFEDTLVLLLFIRAHFAISFPLSTGIDEGTWHIDI
jgi:hypothetical protein